MKMMDGYADSVKLDKTMRSSTAHVGYLLRTSPDWDYVRKLRDEWDGHLIVKGLSRPEDAQALEKEGVDALWVSNHAGRQFDGGPATIETLPLIRKATTLPLIVDSGLGITRWARWVTKALPIWRIFWPRTSPRIWASWAPPLWTRSPKRCFKTGRRTDVARDVFGGDFHTSQAKTDHFSQLTFRQFLVNE